MHTLLIAKSLSLFQTLWCSLCCPACLCYLGADLPELIASNSNSDSWSVPATSPCYPMGSVAGSYELLNVKSALATAVFLFAAACSQNASDFTPPQNTAPEADVSCFLLLILQCVWCTALSATLCSFPRHLQQFLSEVLQPSLLSWASPRELRSWGQLVSPLPNNLNSLVHRLLSPCRFFFWICTELVAIVLLFFPYWPFFTRIPGFSVRAVRERFLHLVLIVLFCSSSNPRSAV